MRLDHGISARWAVRREVLPFLCRALISQASGQIRVPAPEALGEHEAAAPRGVRVTGGVAVLPLRGLITPQPTYLSMLLGGSGGLQGFRAAFRAAMDDPDVSSIVIDVDSPGGSTDLVAETAAEIRAARGTKPIVAVSNTLAASAAYWIASQADELIVTPSGEVGSVGVYMVHEDWSGWLEQRGIDPTYIHAGKYKVEGNPDEPLSDEARDAFQEVVDGFYDMFVADVAKGRGVKPAAVKSGFGEGRCILAKQAVALGMADRVDTFENTVTRLVRNPRSRRSSAEHDEPRPESTTAEAEALEAEQHTPGTGDQERLVEIRDSLISATDSLTGKE